MKTFYKPKRLVLPSPEVRCENIPKKELITNEKHFFQPPEPQPEPQPQNCTIQRYKAMAIKDYSKTLIKDRITFKNTYMELWYDGMKTILQPTGITKNDFVNFI